jgi:hypothetical protein
LYGHEILLANGIRYKGNPILPSEWLKDDAVKSRDRRHADFETEDRELEFKHNEYYLKPSHFFRDILPRFKDPKKRWTLVVLDKNKCVYIMELIKYYHIELLDLEDFRKYCEQKAKKTMCEESGLGCMGERGLLHCRMLLVDKYLSSNYSSSFYECMIKENKTIKTRFRDLLPICRIHSCLVDTMHFSTMHKEIDTRTKDTSCGLSRTYKPMSFAPSLIRNLFDGAFPCPLGHSKIILPKDLIDSSHLPSETFNTYGSLDSHQTLKHLNKGRYRLKTLLFVHFLHWFLSRIVSIRERIVKKQVLPINFGHLTTDNKESQKHLVTKRYNSFFCSNLLLLRHLETLLKTHRQKKKRKLVEGFRSSKAVSPFRFCDKLVSFS